MKPFLVKVLCCPGCHGDLALTSAEFEDAEVRSGKLVCLTCSQDYPIVNFVPRFVPSAQYAASFSEEWRLFERIPRDTAMLDEFEQGFRQETAFTPEELTGRLVLDAGCGGGRYTWIPQKWGAEVIGVDLSAGVDVAFRWMGKLPSTHFIQADIASLPFRPGTFDAIYSLGVLHHTPDPAKSFARLPPLLRPGGCLAILVYGVLNRFQEKVWGSFNLIRRLTRRLPHSVLIRLAYLAVPLYYVYRIPLLGSLLYVLAPIPLSRNPIGRVVGTFDLYASWYTYRFTYHEVFEWFKHAGLVGIELPPYHVTMRGYRPTTNEQQHRKTLTPAGLGTT